MTSFFSQLWSFIKTVAIAAFLAFFVIRGFMVEPFRIPSSSMMPNLLIGDYLVVSKFAYGNRLPLTDYFFWQREPERGDIVVFRRKSDELPGSFFGYGPTLFIKRLVGLPGDRIAFSNQTLLINGVEMPLTDKGTYPLALPLDKGFVEAQLKEENLLGVKHDVLFVPGAEALEVAETVIPAGYYVVMGDNRDNSKDSRYWQHPSWGFVPKADIMGRAELIVWSWDEHWVPRFERVLTNLRAKHDNQ